LFFFSETLALRQEPQPFHRSTAWQLLRAGLAGQQGGNPGTGAPECDKVNSYAMAVQDTLGLSGWHKMQHLQQQHSCKELGLRESSEGKMNDPRYFGFIHCCIKVLRKSMQSSEGWVWHFFSE